MSAGITSAAVPVPHPGSALPRPLVQYIIGNCGALLLGLGVAYLALLRGGHITGQTIRTGDFVQYYGISRLILAGHGAAIYDFARLSHVEAQIVYPLSVQHGVLPYLYPPYFALVCAPLAALPYAAAYSLWLLANCLLLVVSLYALERYAELSGRSALIVRLAAVCSLPLIMTLALGQVSIFILALFAGSLFALRSGRPGMAGVLLALALIKPPYVLPLLVVFLVQRRWRALAAFAGTCCVLFLAPLPLLGLSINSIYARLLIEVNRWQGQSSAVEFHHVRIAAATYDPHVNQGLSGFTQLLLSPSAARIATYALSLAVLVLLGWYAVRSRDVDVPFGLAVIAGLLINPHVLVHDLTLVLIPVFLALRFRSAGPALLGALLCALYVMITLGYPLSYAMPIQLATVGTLALGGWLYVVLRAHPRGRPA